jgi:opacity protein-like surface antigen
MKLRMIAVFSIASLLPNLAAAQESTADRKRTWNARPKIEIIASVAMTHVFRFPNHSFGNHPNFGVAVELPVWGKLRIGAEFNQSFGLTTAPVKCGSILLAPGQPLPCTGAAREGVSSQRAGSITAAYFFGEGRVQPYLVGGISFLSSKEARSSSVIRQNVLELSDYQLSGTGTGMTAGAGFRASAGRHFSIRPEIRFSDGTARSSLNLSQWRLSLGVAYGW